MQFDKTQLAAMERFYRGNLVNSITGLKPVHLLGSQNTSGITNLAIFSQVIHIGADPALIGVLFRPAMLGMNSLENILATKHFTLNHVNESMLLQAHWTSAKWQESEFKAVGLGEDWKDGFPAPFVAGAPLQIGLSLAEKHDFSINGTCLVIGKIEKIYLPDLALSPDGFVNMEKCGSMACGGLDSYYRPELVSRYAYAKPGSQPEKF
jgi:flavin reductase (DIM6/NTAB) family NADH-FMN oxidoreductase RutF